MKGWRKPTFKEQAVKSEHGEKMRNSRWRNRNRGSRRQSGGRGREWCKQEGVANKVWNDTKRWWRGMKIINSFMGSILSNSPESRKITSLTQFPGNQVRSASRPFPGNQVTSHPQELRTTALSLPPARQSMASRACPNRGLHWLCGEMLLSCFLSWSLTFVASSQHRTFALVKGE